MKEKYKINITNWFDSGITYRYQKYITTCGYLNEDGTVEECNRNLSIAEANKLNGLKFKKKTIINYKGRVLKFEGKKELIDYMKVNYNISCANWFGAYGCIPSLYQNDVLFCGYLNEDGSIDECNLNDNYRGQKKSKKVQAIYKNEKIIKNSFKEMCSYLKEKYGIEGVSSWNSYGIPRKYQQIITSFGYIDEGGNINEFKRNNSAEKKVKAIYKNQTIIKDSKSEFIKYMRDTYGINGVSSWFTKQGIPFKYQNDISSCGYLNEAGIIEECRKVSNAKGVLKKKKVMIIYKEEKIIKNSIEEIVEYFYEKYNISVRHWFYNQVPETYKNQVEYCGVYNEEE